MGGYGLSSYPGYSYKVKYFDKYSVCEKYDLSQTFLGRLPLAQLNYGDANSNMEIFFQTSTPPPRPNSPMRPLRKISFDLDLYKQILREKRGSICQGLQLVECSSNQTLAHIMEGDREAGAREKRGAPNEQKNELENEQEC